MRLDEILGGSDVESLIPLRTTLIAEAAMTASTATELAQLQATVDQCLAEERTRLRATFESEIAHIRTEAAEAHAAAIAAAASDARAAAESAARTATELAQFQATADQRLTEERTRLLAMFDSTLAQLRAEMEKARQAAVAAASTEARAAAEAALTSRHAAEVGRLRAVADERRATELSQLRAALEAQMAHARAEAEEALKVERAGRRADADEAMRVHAQLAAAAADAAAAHHVEMVRAQSQAEKLDAQAQRLRAEAASALDAERTHRRAEAEEAQRRHTQLLEASTQMAAAHQAELARVRAEIEERQRATVASTQSAVDAPFWSEHRRFRTGLEAVDGASVDVHHGGIALDVLPRDPDRTTSRNVERRADGFAQGAHAIVNVLASGTERVRLLLASSQRAARLRERGTSLCITTGSRSYEATRAALRSAVPVIRTFSRNSATWGHVQGHRMYDAARTCATRLDERRMSIWEALRARDSSRPARTAATGLRLVLGPDVGRTIALSACGIAFGLAVGGLLITYFPSLKTPAARIEVTAPTLTLAGASSSVPKVAGASAQVSAPRVARAADVGRATGVRVAQADVRETALRMAVAPQALIRADASAMGNTTGASPRVKASDAAERKAPAGVRPTTDAGIPRPAQRETAGSVAVYRGSVAVDSSPQGGRVFINGVSVGITPLLLRDLPVGSRAVRVELDGHDRWSTAIRIVASERTSVSAKLIPSSLPE